MIVKTDLIDGKGYVYVLKHPQTNEVVYVGSAMSAQQRLYQHIKNAENCNIDTAPILSKWIRSLKEDGFDPIMEVIEICDACNLLYTEKQYIAKFHNIKPLLNKRHIPCVYQVTD